VNIDHGFGVAVIDRLRDLGYKVNEIKFGGKAVISRAYANRRADMWGAMKDWLATGCIDNDRQLHYDLMGPEDKFGRNSDLIMLESKEDMKRRGLDSPDDGDALALTFAVNVAHNDTSVSRHRRATHRVKVADGTDYDVFDIT
jgi:hypothetical protein